MDETKKELVRWAWLTSLIAVIVTCDIARPNLIHKPLADLPLWLDCDLALLKSPCPALEGADRCASRSPARLDQVCDLSPHNATLFGQRRMPQVR